MQNEHKDNFEDNPFSIPSASGQSPPNHYGMNEEIIEDSGIPPHEVMHAEEPTITPHEVTRAEEPTIPRGVMCIEEAATPPHSPRPPSIAQSLPPTPMFPHVTAEMEENMAFARESPLIKALSSRRASSIKKNKTEESDTSVTEFSSGEIFGKNINEYDVQIASGDREVHDIDGKHNDSNPTAFRANDAAILAAAIADDGNNGASSRVLPPGVSLEAQQEDVLIRILAGQLKREWKKDTMMTPSLERRLRDFQFAQQKRRDKYGNSRPWGILGLYDHLAAIRIDVEWSEDAAWRREHGEPYLSWSDFDENKDSGFNKPFFTYILLLICTATLIVSIWMNGWKIAPMNVNVMIGPSAETLVIMGAKKTDLIVEQGEWYRIFTPMFLHAGLIHYVVNMLALWFIGSAVEQCHGFVAATILFVIPAIGGTILSAIFLPEYISVGASGGIFGLIGACIADIAMNWSLLFSRQVNAEDSGTTCRHIRILILLILDIAVNCLIGLTPFVDNFTHVGGMVYGFLCGLSTMERLPTDFFGVSTGFCDHVKQVCVRFSGLILSVALIMVTTALLAESNGMTSPCPNCRYLSCVPFPPWAPEDEKWWYCDDCGTVTADARRDNNLNIFDELTLVCPDGDIEIIDIQQFQLSDKDQLSSDLPDYCRNYCENVYAT